LEEFGGFGDFMCSFNLLRGKKTEDEDDEERRFSGRFKVSFEETALWKLNTIELLFYFCISYNNGIINLYNFYPSLGDRVYF